MDKEREKQDTPLDRFIVALNENKPYNEGLNLPVLANKQSTFDRNLRMSLKRHSKDS